MDKITDNIFENFEPIESKFETKEDIEIKIDKYLKESSEQIFKKVHKYEHCFEKKMFKYVKFIFERNKNKNKTELIIKNNHHILKVFQVYNKLLKQIDFKWNNKKREKIVIKK